ncbi:ribonuclease toxin immunity protein CdiI [Paenibacillus sp. ALJ109b]|uniref:ribonuclease toxin immunity protein CdiI n=1 Tax=Paenibacillus sp. ALJ109b TaxID=2709068 RepID=UPI001F07A6B0|nr:ribonuclease toxin immunity protein CdiI [Paenibacillus sp. ALJ109b]
MMGHEMDYDNEKNRKMILSYYKVLGDDRFLTILDSYSKAEGYGVEAVWCVFAHEFKSWEEDYFGDTGVIYFFDYPIVPEEESVILDNEVFIKYLKEASAEYLTRHPNQLATVEDYIIRIEKEFVSN